MRSEWAEFIASEGRLTARIVLTLFAFGKVPSHCTALETYRKRIGQVGSNISPYYQTHPVSESARNSSVITSPCLFA